MNKSFNKHINWITISGGLPLLALLLLPTPIWNSIQGIGVIYLGVILSFIAGINWSVAIQRKSLKLLLWSIALSLLTCGATAVPLLYSSTITAWIVLWLLLNTAWIVDHKLYDQQPLLQRLRCFGSITLNILIIAIIIRHCLIGINH